MSEDAPVESDDAPFPEPYPEMAGIGPVDVESVREWMFRRDQGEASRPRSDG